MPTELKCIKKKKKHDICLKISFEDTKEDERAVLTFLRGGICTALKDRRAPDCGSPEAMGGGRTKAPGPNRLRVAARSQRPAVCLVWTQREG